MYTRLEKVLKLCEFIIDVFSSSAYFYAWDVMSKTGNVMATTGFCFAQPTFFKIDTTHSRSRTHLFSNTADSLDLQN